MFTLRQFHAVYEAVLGEPINKPPFPMAGRLHALGSMMVVRRIPRTAGGKSGELRKPHRMPVKNSLDTP
jgi:hypothetical protein